MKLSVTVKLLLIASLFLPFLSSSRHWWEVQLFASCPFLPYRAVHAGRSCCQSLLQNRQCRSVTLQPSWDRAVQLQQVLHHCPNAGVLHHGAKEMSTGSLEGMIFAARIYFRENIINWKKKYYYYFIYICSKSVPAERSSEPTRIYKVKEYHAALTFSLSL